MTLAERMQEILDHTPHDRARWQALIDEIRQFESMVPLELESESARREFFESIPEMVSKWHADR